MKFFFLLLSSCLAAPTTAFSAKRCATLESGFRQSIPLEPVRISTPNGKTTLENAQRDGNAVSYVEILKHYESQMTPNTCSVASGTIALRYLRPSHIPFPQERFLNAGTDQIRPSRLRKRNGISVRDLPDGQVLGQLFRMLTEVHGLKGRITHVTETKSSVEDFRRELMAAVKSVEKMMIVNYYERDISPSWSDIGHFSPVAAYDKSSDRVLIADVFRSSEKVPPSSEWFWVDLPTLHKAMLKVDGDSGLRRGYLILE